MIVLKPAIYELKKDFKMLRYLSLNLLSKNILNHQ